MAPGAPFFMSCVSNLGFVFNENNYVFRINVRFAVAMDMQTNKTSVLMNS